MTAVDSAQHRAAPGLRPRTGRHRVIALRLLYGLLSLWTLAMAHGIVLLATGADLDGMSSFAVAVTTPWKLLSLGGAIAIFALTCRASLAAQWLLLGQLCWGVAEVLAPQEGSIGAGEALAVLVLPALIWVGPWLLLSPRRAEAVRLRSAPDPVLLGVWAVAAGPLVLWVVDVSSTTVSDALPSELRYDVTGLGLGLLVLGLWAALRPHGAAWPALAVATAGAWLAVAALVAPAATASPGRGWAALALVASVAFLVRADVLRRRDAARGGSSDGGPAAARIAVDPRGGARTTGPHSA